MARTLNPPDMYSLFKYIQWKFTLELKCQNIDMIASSMHVRVHTKRKESAVFLIVLNLGNYL